MYRDRQLLIAKIFRANYKQILKPAHWLVNQLRYNLSSVARTAKMLIGHAPMDTDDTPRRGISVSRCSNCIELASWQKNTSRFFTVCHNNPRPRIFRAQRYAKRILRRKKKKNNATIKRTTSPRLWKLKRTLLLTLKTLNSIDPSNKDQINSASLLGMHAHVYSHYQRTKAGEEEENVSMEDLRGSRVVAQCTPITKL